MAVPVFEVYEAGGVNKALSKSFGQIKAGTESSEYEVEIWNNKGGTSDVSDIIEAVIAATNSSGAFAGEIITGKYVQVKVNNDNYVAIGADDDGQGTIIPVKAPIRAAAFSSSSDAGGGGKFSGASNNGIASQSTSNAAIVKIKIVLPANATSGSKSGKIRVEGYYV